MLLCGFMILCNLDFEEMLPTICFPFLRIFVIMIHELGYSIVVDKIFVNFNVFYKRNGPL